MRALADKIIEECNISKKLRLIAWNAEYSKSEAIRKEQELHWKKFDFLRKLSKALERKEVE